MKIFKILALSFLCCAMFAAPVWASEKKDENVGGKEFVKLDPLILPIIDEDGVQQVVNLVVTLEVDSLSDADKVKAMRPRLTDAYIEDMYGILHKHAALKGGIIQISMIKKRLNDITSHIMGDEIHANVLLQHVQQRPI